MTDKTIDFENIKLIIFDCDGVLIDSEWLCIEVLIKLLKQHKVNVDTPYFYTHFLGRHFQQIIDCALNDFNINLPANFETTYQKMLMETFQEQLLPCHGIVSILQQLKIAKCIATSSFPERTKHALKITQLSNYFGNNVFTASEVKNGKPAPDLFLHAAKNMEIEPAQCLVIEDSGAGLLAAKAAGMPVIHYRGGKHFSGDVPFKYPNEMKDTLILNNWSEFIKLVPNLFKELKVSI